jgi:hypothetical protein
MSELTSAFGGIADMVGLAACSARSRLTRSGPRTFGRILPAETAIGSYRELRLELLCCPHRLSRGTAPHEREYPRRKDRF